MKLTMDDKNVIKKTFDKVIEKYNDDFDFVVRNANFIFVFRNKALYDDEGFEIAAQARQVPNRERDLYGTDFEISVYEELWNELDGIGKERLIYHELLHCRVVEDEEDENSPSYDNDGRVKIYIEPHDIVVKTFKQEIEKFGLSRGDLDTAKFFYKQIMLLKSKKKEG